MHGIDRLIRRKDSEDSEDGTSRVNKMHGIDRLIGRKDSENSGVEDRTAKVYYESIGYEKVDGDHLRSWIKDTLGPYKVVDKVDLLEAIDLNIVNKLYRLGKGSDIYISSGTHKTLTELGYTKKEECDLDD